MAASKSFQLSYLIKLLKSFAGEIKPNYSQEVAFADIIHNSLLEVYTQAGLEKILEYYVELNNLVHNPIPVTVPPSTENAKINLLSTNTLFVIDTSVHVTINEIVFLKGNGSGGKLMLPLNIKEFERIKEDAVNASQFYYCHKPAYIEIAYCSSALAFPTSYTLGFYRRPVKAISDVTYLDIPDIYFWILFDTAKKKIFETLNMTPPADLTLEAIRARLDKIQNKQ